MKALTQTLLVATYLYAISLTKCFSFCTQCGQVDCQIFLHFYSNCPKFHYVRTAAHNQVCKVLAASLYKHLAAHWSLYDEPQLSQTGLVLELIPTAIVLQSGRQVPDSDTAAM